MDALIPTVSMCVTVFERREEKNSLPLLFRIQDIEATACSSFTLFQTKYDNQHLFYSQKFGCML